jgi:hypothetical protein
MQRRWMYRPTRFGEAMLVEFVWRVMLGIAALLLRMTPRSGGRVSRLAGHIEVDGVIAELVAIGLVCGKIRDLGIGIVCCCTNSSKREEGHKLHDSVLNGLLSWDEGES